MDEYPAHSVVFLRATLEKTLIPHYRALRIYSIITCLAWKTGKVNFELP